MAAALLPSAGVGHSFMSKRKTHFEQIPVEFVKKIAGLQPVEASVVAKSSAPKTEPYATPVVTGSKTCRNQNSSEE